MKSKGQSAPRFLLIDVGNTVTKYAIAGVEGPIQPAGKSATIKATSDGIVDLAKRYSNFQVVLSSVVPTQTSEYQSAFHDRLHIVTAKSFALGLSFDYPNPAELGADRLAAAVAAYADKIWPTIIVSCGTANAFTVLNTKGQLCGGVISAGLFTQLTSLVHATAQLPSTDLRKPYKTLGRSTEEAVRAGAMLSFQGGTNEILHKLGDSLKVRHPHILLTGGYADYLTKSLDIPYTLRPLLVFEGLRIIGTRAFAETL